MGAYVLVYGSHQGRWISKNAALGVQVHTYQRNHTVGIAAEYIRNHVKFVPS
jgi:hypothetical protein